MHNDLLSDLQCVASAPAQHLEILRTVSSWVARGAEGTQKSGMCPHRATGRADCLQGLGSSGGLSAHDEAQTMTLALTLTRARGRAGRRPPRGASRRRAGRLSGTRRRRRRACRSPTPAPAPASTTPPRWPAPATHGTTLGALLYQHVDSRGKPLAGSHVARAEVRQIYCTQ